MVHHDIWDYDAPSPTVLFDAKVDGDDVHGIGEAAKTGWLYLLNRETGKPLFPITRDAGPAEREAEDVADPADPVLRAVRPARAVAGAVRAGAQLPRRRCRRSGAPVKAIKAQGMFTPYWKTMVVLTPGPQGGTNWQPSSYNQKTHMFYVCAQSGVTGHTAGRSGRKQGRAQSRSAGRSRSPAASARTRDFTAIDATTGKIVWQKRLARVVLRRLRDDRRQHRLHRAQQRRPSGLQRDQRQPALELPDRRGRERRPDDLPAQRQGVRRVLRRRQRARRHGARRQPLAVLARRRSARSPRPAAADGVGHAGETPAPATPKPTTTTTAPPAATRPPASRSSRQLRDCHGAGGTGGNGGPDLTSIAGAKNLESVASRSRMGAEGCPRSRVH